MQPKQLRVLLRPIIKLCLRYSLGLHDLVEAAKIMFIQVAEEELESQGQKVSVSRLSVVTGVHRKDAERIYRQHDFDIGGMRLSGKVISQWRRDKRFLSANGKPRVLTYIGDDSEFARLIRAVSGELKSGTILFDLERIGAVKKTDSGLKLTAKSYSAGNDAEEGLRMLAGDTSDLYDTVMENITSPAGEPAHYHAKATCDNLAVDELPKIRKWFFNSCANFHERALRYLAQFDIDTNRKLKGKKGGGKFSLGLFTHATQSKK